MLRKRTRTLIIGRSDMVGVGDAHAFAYDLGAASPAMQDLGTLSGTTSVAVTVSGKIVAGSSDTAGGATHAAAWSLATATTTTSVTSSANPAVARHQDPQGLPQCCGCRRGRRDEKEAGLSDARKVYL